MSLPPIPISLFHSLFSPPQQVVLLGGQGVWYPAPALPLELAPPPPSLSPHLLETATFGEHRHSNAAAAAQDLSAHAHNDTAEEVEQALPGITSSAHRNAAPESEDTIGDMRSDQQNLATAEECDAGRAPREQRRNVLRAELKDRIGVDKGRSALWHWSGIVNVLFDFSFIKVVLVIMLLAFTRSVLTLF